MSAPPAPDRATLRRLIMAHGRDAVAFQGLEPGLEVWLDGDPAAPRAAVAYHDTGSAWIAAGGPHAPLDQRAEVAARFAAAAAAAGRRAGFFAVDDVDRWPGFSRTLLGEQPAWTPAAWADTLRHHRKLREQLRRARAKGVRVRRVDPEQLAPGTPLRAELDAVASAWLASRHMEPMGFLVTLAPFEWRDDHRYYVAERHGRVVEFLSLVPVPARDGWLLEDLLRTGSAPNGTSESLIDAALRDLADEGAGYATTGLAPLSGPVPGWMRALGRLGGSLYDFTGLRRFKERLHPPAWEQVWLVHPDDAPAPLMVIESLRAFAPGGLIRFATRTVVRHPGALAWLLAVPLVPWAALLAAAAATGHAALWGFGAATLAGWSIYDALLAAGLWRASRRPRPGLLTALAGAATVDATVSTVHLLVVGPGPGLASAAVRLLSTAAPLTGAAGLWWARRQAAAGPPPGATLGHGR